MSNDELYVLITQDEKDYIAGQMCVRMGDCHGLRLETHTDGRFKVPADLWQRWVTHGLTTTPQP